MKSLIIDDEADARARLARMLKKYPEIVVIGEARDGLEAIEQIERLQPELLFLDIEMRGLNGFEVLRSIPDKVALPLVIFVTGYDNMRWRRLRRTRWPGTEIGRAHWGTRTGARQHPARGSGISQDAAPNCVPQAGTHGSCTGRANPLV